MRLGARLPRVRARYWRLTGTMASVLLTLTSCGTLAGPGAATSASGTGAPQSGAPATAQPTAHATAHATAHPSGQGNGSDLPSAQNGKHWVLTYDQEFNTKRIRTPAHWNYFTGGNGWSHSQLQYFTSANAQTNGQGQLVLSAKNNNVQGLTCWYGPCKYSGARMETQGIFAQKYGEFEAKIKIPYSAGIWPAFWMQGPSAEIDIIETNSKDGRRQVHSAAHAPGMDHAGNLRLPQPLSDAYHVYGVTWTPSGITWTVDGKAYSHLAAYPGWTFDTPFFLILDVAVGGPWPGPPNASTQFPSTMSVDWVRVYREAS